MNNIVTGFDQILEFAGGYGLPPTKKKAILREYLQTKILDLLYKKKISSHLYFIGGTALRLLYGLNRFSEDLDFDILNISKIQIDRLMVDLHQSFLGENIAVDLYKNQTGKRYYYELRFKKLLFELNLSGQQEEKLSIKFDFETFWRGQEHKVRLLSRYGFLINIVTIPLGQVLVQKLFAYTQRKQTLPRDLYEVVWLYAQEAQLDKNFMKANKLPADLLVQASKQFEREKSRLKTFVAKLKPFLIDEDEVEKIKLFPQVLSRLNF